LPFYYNLRRPRSAIPRPDPASGINCTFTPAGDGSFTQNVQRLAFYAEDSWRASHHLTINYGLRYQTTFGLIQCFRPAANLPTLRFLCSLRCGYPLGPPPARRPQADRAASRHRLFSRQTDGKTVFRAGFGMFYDDLAQNGWATAFQDSITRTPLRAP
jgi:outer membrane receptor protein involved in Fe transport